MVAMAITVNVSMAFCLENNLSIVQSFTAAFWNSFITNSRYRNAPTAMISSNNFMNRFITNGVL